MACVPIFSYLCSMNQPSAIQELQRQKLLLQLEYATEKEAFRQMTETIGLERKVKRGDAWYPLRVGKTYYNSLNQLSVEVYRTQDADIEHNFEYGRPVIFFQTGGAFAPCETVRQSV